MDEKSLTESINSNSDQSFRFCKLPIYDKELSGCGCKEMDFAWSVNGDLYLMEVYSKNVFRRKLDKGKVNEFFKEIAGKIADSLSMLGAVWLDTNWGQRFSKQIPDDFHSIPDNKTRQIKLFVLFIGEGDYQLLDDPVSKVTRMDELKKLVYCKSQMLDIKKYQFAVLTPKLATELLIGKNGSRLLK